MVFYSNHYFFADVSYWNECDLINICHWSVQDEAKTYSYLKISDESRNVFFQIDCIVVSEQPQLAQM